VTSTVTSYLSKIKQNFPVKGQDNDSQGFRDNFHNIHEAIKYVNSNVDLLDQLSIKTNTTSTFGGNTIDSANFKNCSNELYSYALQTDTINIDYSLGSYQKFELSAGTHDLYIDNWPGAGKTGNLKLSVTPAGEAYTAINFLRTTDLGPVINPYQLTPGIVNIFELWNESDNGPVFVKQLNDFVFDSSTATHVAWFNQLKIGILNNSIQTNTFSTGTKRTTVVRNSTSSAALALIPNRISKTVVKVTQENPPGGYAEFEFDDVSDIERFSTFTLSTGSNTIYTVNTVTTSTILVIPNDIDFIHTDVVGKSITFINPTFTEQSTVVTLVPTPATTATGTYTNYIGSIYADEHRLEVTYDDYGNGVTNTMRLKTMVTATQVTNTSTDLVSAQFVHSILPYGSITMWYGTVANIPVGWHLCDGTNGTPNLVDRFIVGAGLDYIFSGNPNYQASTNIMGTTSTIGGSSSTVLVSHTHEAATGEVKFDISHEGLVIDGGHQHYVPQLVSDDANNNGANGKKYGPPSQTDQTTKEVTGIRLDPHKDVTIPAGAVSIEAAGTSTYSHTNIPPFYALCYIMKTTGFGVVGTL
jgi:hypothetical protein